MRAKLSGSRASRVKAFRVHGLEFRASAFRAEGDALRLASRRPTDRQVQ